MCIRAEWKPYCIVDGYMHLNLFETMVIDFTNERGITCNNFVIAIISNKWRYLLTHFGYVNVYSCSARHISCSFSFYLSLAPCPPPLSVQYFISSKSFSDTCANFRIFTAKLNQFIWLSFSLLLLSCRCCGCCCWVSGSEGWISPSHLTYIIQSVCLCLCQYGQSVCFWGIYFL